jgi:hypothetical protein
MERNYMEMYFAENLKNRPEDFMFTDKGLAEFEENMKRMRAKRAAANPIKPEPAQQELNRLRGQLFNLQQYAEGIEQKVNDQAGTVQLFELRITEALKTKKQYEESGNLMGARTVEYHIQKLESELADAREVFVKDQHYSVGAARSLRTWQTENGPRLKELQHEIKKLA